MKDPIYVVTCLALALLFSSCGKKKEVVTDGPIVSLFSVAERNDVEGLASLIRANANLQELDAQGNTALHLAAKNGSVEVAQKMIQSGIPIDAQNAAGETALITATRASQVEMVKMLLLNNASPDIKDDSGFRPITIAAESGDESVLEPLAIYSAKFLDDALFIAALKGRSNIVNTLANHGASVYSRLDADGRTPLMLAAQNGHQETVRVLLENGANRYSTDEDGQTASQLAQLSGHLAVAEFLGEMPARRDLSLVENDPAILQEAVEEVVLVGEAFNATVGGGQNTKPKSNEPRDLNVEVMTIEQYTAPAETETPLAEALTFKTYREESIPIQVRGVDAETVSVKYLYGNHDTVEVATGEIIPETNLKVISATARRDHSKMSANGAPADVSIVMVRDQNTGLEREVTAGLNFSRSEPFALMLAQGSDSLMIAKRGDLFQDSTGVRYQVLEVRPTQLVVENKTTSEVLTIKK